jgi:regulator of protease activity HflC (stomatin/prohibitin superfamily)
MSWLAVLKDWVSEFWPFVTVDEWERGVYFIHGRPLVRQGTINGIPYDISILEPGLYVHLPWFHEVLTVDIVPTPLGTQLLNITLSDNKTTVSFSLTYIVQVEDPMKALCEVDNYKESTGEIVTSVVAEKLAEVPVDRLDPERRKRLVQTLIATANSETLVFGVRVLAIRFTNFAINQKAYRLLTDTAIGSIAWSTDDD